MSWIVTFPAWFLWLVGVPVGLVLLFCVFVAVLFMAGKGWRR